jgi:mannose-6-phosphate isomerase-like protein (cupin superfamily)
MAVGTAGAQGPQAVKRGGIQMDIRRVVTGHDEKGKSIFVSDEPLTPVTLSALPGAEFHKVWGGDEAPTFPDGGSALPHVTYFPPVGGFRFGLFTLPPAGVAAAPADLDVGAALAEMEEKLPGLQAVMEPDDPGMHTTDTVDYEVVLSGEVVLELDDGAETVLRPGDSVVQNGTRHRWHNRGDEPAVLAVAIVGAHRG